jgi:ribosome-binding factor A
MSRRTDRVGNLIRNTLAEILMAKIADPRIDPARTSITRVEVDEDLLQAKVFVSVSDSETKQKRTVAALRHAAGRMQEEMMRKIRLRNTPRLSFQIDTRFKKTIETLSLISEVAEELRQKDEARAREGDESSGSESGQEGEA